MEEALATYNQDFNKSIAEVRPEQMLAIRHLLKSDVLLVLPTGYGKSLVYELLPYMVSSMCHQKALIVAVIPLNAIIDQELKSMGSKGVHLCKETLDTRKERITCGEYTYILGHPEDILLPESLVCLTSAMVHYDRVFVIVDEAHCIVEWGESFRPEFTHIANLRPSFPDLTMLAMTATASPSAQNEIVQKLAMRKPKILNETPVLNRNVKLSVCRRISSTGGQHTAEASFDCVFKPILAELYSKGSNFPTTIVYCHLKWCGYGYQLAQRMLQDRFWQGEPSVDNCVVVQYHSPQPSQVRN
jgi:ATP-dependent DNA helicase RecQ